MPLRVVINFTTSQADNSSKGENSRVDMLTLTEDCIPDSDVGGGGSAGGPCAMELLQQTSCLVVERERRGTLSLTWRCAWRDLFRCHAQRLSTDAVASKAALLW